MINLKTKDVSAAAVQVVKANEVTLYTGDDAWKLLSSDSFLEGWDELYEACSWATVYQSRAFVSTWYNHYRLKYSPIIVTSTYGGRLVGLITLAIRHYRGKTERIIGAGNYESEYQVWITESKQDTQFAPEALRKVIQRFPKNPLHLRFVPSKVPLQWIDEPYWKKRCIAEPFRRPLMDMSDPNLDKLLNKTEFRRKINRAKRLGNVMFERITSKADFEAMLGDSAMMYDFRQGARFNLNQFEGEPVKPAFFVELFEKNLLHVTVLKVNNQIVAALVAATSRGWVHMHGLNSYSPFGANFYSPGLVHFIMAGQLMAQEDVEVFDLTPGGDSYKERLATRHDEVNELVISNSLFYLTRRKLRKRYFDYLEKKGKWPLGTMVAYKKKMYLFKARLRKFKKQGPIKAITEKIKYTVHPLQDKIYVAHIDTSVFKTEMPIHKNSLRHILDYEAKGSWVTRWGFLEQAMYQYESGGSSYSFGEEGCMLGCAWIGAPSEKPKESEDNPAKTQALLQDLYCHPKGESQFASFLKTLVHTVGQEHKTDRVYIRVQDPRLCRLLEETGFTKAAHEDIEMLK